MKSKTYTIGQQIQRNLLAIISLTVAISALSYNTWRNETTEVNRNIRTASFEVLVQLGKLQIITDHAHYGKDKQMGNPITGWGHVTMVEDLSFLMPEPLPEMATDLKAVWQKNWEAMNRDKASAMKITESISSMRAEVKAQLKTIK
ncbi:MAG: hypothetical protein KAJ95_05765 [Gammaproteobacteria bacterium]|nr:hypothetical protein [Gammaproteobacteria bacterium]